MKPEEFHSSTRRRLLRIAGISAVGVASLTRSGPAQAQSADASVTIEDQESDGERVVIQEAHTSARSELVIGPESKVLVRGTEYLTFELDPETELANAELPLDSKIPETQRLRATIRKDGDSIARDTAIVAVDEPLGEVSPSDWLPIEESVDFVEADPEAGFHFPYLLYAPAELDSGTDAGDGPEERPLFVRPSQSSSPDLEERIQSANKTIQGGVVRRFANRTSSPALVTALPNGADPTNEIPRGSMGRKGLSITEPPYERVDMQLLAQIEDAETRLEDTVETGKIHLGGYSANGRFVDMFAALHPDRVNALSSGGNGVAILPTATLEGDVPTHGDPETDTLPWPVGVADMRELAGETFSEDAWMNIDQYRYIGGEDQWDPSKHDHPREYHHSLRYKHLGEDLQQLVIDIFGWEQVDERFEASRAIYDHLDVPAQFERVDGEGHLIDGNSEDVLEFHLEAAREEFEAVERTRSSERGENDGDSSETSASNSTSASGPGFGILAAVVGLLGGTALKRDETRPGS